MPDWSWLYLFVLVSAEGPSDGLDWEVLDWAVLGRFNLDWILLGRVLRLECAGLDYKMLSLALLGLAKLRWAGLGSVKMGCALPGLAGLGWIVL